MADKVFIWRTVFHCFDDTTHSVEYATWFEAHDAAKLWNGLHVDHDHDATVELITVVLPDAPE